MFQDARAIPKGTVLETEVAIIGSGPAGMTVAHELLPAGLRLCLIESGGLEFDAEVQSLAEGESVGIKYPIDASRLRFFGGSSNHWGGYCRPMDPMDFDIRDWVPHSGWPLKRHDLDPFYERAQSILDLGPMRYEDSRAWNAELGEKDFSFPCGRFTARVFQFSPPTRFGEKYRHELEQSHAATVLLHANVVAINADEHGRRIRDLSIKCLDGNALRVKARVFVLAAGGLDNPRLLLASHAVQKEGLGNQHGLVGRFFMEHPHLDGFADVVVADAARVPKFHRERQVVFGVSAQAAWTPTEAAMRERQLLNAGFMVGLARTYDAGETSEGIDGERHGMLRAARAFLRRDEAKNGPDGHWVTIGCACEQEPNPESRVTLSSEKDRLGVPRLKLDWRLSDADRRSVIEHIRGLAHEWGAMGIGRLRRIMSENGAWPDFVRGGNHHMGTTRMSDDPKSGVVDRHARVHGIENLYVAGSSVFATSGAANPTHTIVALAVRLADRIKEVML